MSLSADDEDSSPVEWSAIELLPPEMICHIAQYLSLRDLSACCAVSHRMRFLFDINSEWKKYCSIAHSEYLLKTDCKVEPRFVSPEQSESTMIPISEWRLAYMRENHLWNNWRQGRFKMEEIVDRENDWLICYQFITNDWAIAIFGSKIKVIDISKHPAKYIDGTEIEIPEQLSQEWQLQAGRDMIVINIWHINFVGVYHLDMALQECSLIHEFCFDKIKKSTDERLERMNPTFNLCKELPLNEIINIKSKSWVEKIYYKAIRIVAGKFFVGIVEGDNKLHIWNLETGVKLKEEVCPITECEVLEMKATDTMNIVLTVIKTGTICISFIVYCLTQLAFFSFRITTHTVHYDYIVNKDLFVLLSCNGLEIYNYRTNKLLHNSQNYYDSLANPQFVNNNLLFVADETLYRFNTSTEKVEPLMDGITTFKIVTGRFLEIEVSDGSIDIWEIDRKFKSLKKTSMSLECDPYIFFNKLSTQCLLRLRRKLFAIHFW